MPGSGHGRHGKKTQSKSAVVVNANVSKLDVHSDKAEDELSTSTLSAVYET